jgi:hypothetical protein
LKVDLFALLAVVLGILYTKRKLDVKRRTAAGSPHVPAADFERWQRREIFAYNLASSACALKVVVDIALYVVHQRIPWTLVRVIGFTAFFAWIAALVASLVLGSRARKLREELRIDLTKPEPEPP